MQDTSFETIEQVQKRQFPESAQQYIAHEKWLDKHYRDGPMRGIEKEIEGMIRLFKSVSDELDEEDLEVLLCSIKQERHKLRRLEEDIQRELPPIESADEPNNCEG